MSQKEKTKVIPGTKSPGKYPSPIKRNAPSVKPDHKAYFSPEEDWDNLTWESQRG